MLEAFVIIVALGGLKIVLWYLDRREQRKEIELLDSIWAELGYSELSRRRAAPIVTGDRRTSPKSSVV